MSKKHISGKAQQRERDRRVAKQAKTHSKPKPKAKAKSKGPAKVLQMRTPAPTPAPKRKVSSKHTTTALPADTYKDHELLEDFPELVKKQQAIKRQLASFKVKVEDPETGRDIFVSTDRAMEMEKAIRAEMEGLLCASDLDNMARLEDKTAEIKFVTVNGLKVAQTVQKGRATLSTLLLIEHGVPVEVIEECTVPGDPVTYVTVRSPKAEEQEGVGDVEAAG